MSALEGLSENQFRAMVYTERVNSSVSLACIIFVLVTYLFAPGFDKPINRLIFFASFGNMGSNIASLISEIGPLAGSDAAVCQAQAFLVQMFLGVDCYWAFCMAINVYLIFFRDYTTERLRGLDIYYLLACYGLSFIPALIFIFVTTPDQGRVYGPAIIWCWITPDWDWMRLVFLYAIVWIASLFAFIVYVMAGKVIWDKRRHLDGFLNPFNENPFTNTITTEIEITHEDRPIVKEAGAAGVSEGFATDRNDGVDYLVRISTEAEPARPLPTALRMRSITRDVAQRETNAEAWLYARVAFLFFIALLITWVPTSVNRVYAIVHPDIVNFPLNYVSSFVFPLQGFWNTIVYMITSQTACRRLFRAFFPRPSGRIRRRSRSSSIGANLTGGKFHETGPKHRLQSVSSWS